ncbi:hypothetical protein [Streptomyces sp. NPDC057545]|uniref:hypothetical protein n=1 Tax=Streptomyces sp. NPDC057545 TaxID=3346164 RepID=UPI0036CE2392
MQRTRTIVKLLAGVAVATLSGCVSVTPQPDVPPRPGNSRPSPDLEPQIARPPVHDGLAVEPAAGPSAASPSPAHGSPPDARRAAPRPPRQRKHTGAVRHRPRQAPPVVPAPVPVLPAPVSGRDVCALGRGYGHWPAGSPQSRICDEPYGR